MCGRYSVNIGRKRFEAVYNVQPPLEFAERYNIAPTQLAPVVRATGDGLEAAMLTWGFQKPGKSLLINARGETVNQLPTFASSFRARRCIVPASGWYEWKASGAGKKQPHHLRSSDGEPLAFAGLWTPSPDGEQFVIVTTAASAAISEIHNRQPVILDRERWRVWLSDAPLSELEAMLEADENVRLEVYPVGARVGNPRNDDEELIRRLSEAGETDT